MLYRLKLPLYTLLIPLALFILASCQLSEPPRLGTATAQAAWTPTPTLERLVLAVETPIPLADLPTDEPENVQPNPMLSVWVNETSAEHRQLLQEMATDFTAVTDIDVALMFVSPLLLPDLVQTAVLSDTLPDIIIHPLQYTPGWLEQGILNPTAAQTAVEQLGSATFDPQALALVTNNGQVGAIPSDGYKQILIYRTDWFNQLNLAPPTNFHAMLAAAQATTDRENLRAGFVIPTESNLVATHQAFEQIALANGCHLIDEKGEVLLPTPPCREALAFYYSIVNQFSPIGVQTETSTRNAYLAGRTGLILYSPDILPQLAGLDTAVLPTCPECAENPTFLTGNSGFITQIEGYGGQTAGFSNLTYLGITRDADVATAVAFADYWFNDGYEKWLSINSERKVPLRLGTAVELTRFIDAWGTVPVGNGLTLIDLYGQETIDQLRQNVAAAPRWGIDQGQGALLSQLYQDLTISITLQEMLSGYFNPDQTIIEAYNRVTDEIPNYAYYIDLEETEESNTGESN